MKTPIRLIALAQVVLYTAAGVAWLAAANTTVVEGSVRTGTKALLVIMPMGALLVGSLAAARLVPRRSVLTIIAAQTTAVVAGLLSLALFASLWRGGVVFHDTAPWSIAARVSLGIAVAALLAACISGLTAVLVRSARQR